MLHKSSYHKAKNKSSSSYIYLGFYCVLALLLLISCERDLTLDIKVNDKRLLVDGEFTNDSVIHSIRLYRPGTFSSGQPQVIVSGALIFVTDKVDTFYYAECDTMPGLYQTIEKCCGTGGNTYTLSISNIDIDDDGELETYSAVGKMPVPVVFDSLDTKFEWNGDHEKGYYYIGNYVLKYNSADYIFAYILINNQQTKWGTIGENLGTGLSYTQFAKQPKMMNTNDEILNSVSYYTTANIIQGDNLCLVGYNFTNEQYTFLKEFDNNTNSNDLFQENLYDQLKTPSNLSTNIEPSNCTAGYFFFYSISRISKIFVE